MHQKGSNGKPQQRVQTVGGAQTFLRNLSVKGRLPPNLRAQNLLKFGLQYFWWLENLQRVGGDLYAWTPFALACKQIMKKRNVLTSLDFLVKLLSHCERLVILLHVQENLWTFRALWPGGGNHVSPMSTIGFFLSGAFQQFSLWQNLPTLLHHGDTMVLGSVCISSSEIYLAQVKSWRTGWSGCTRCELELFSCCFNICLFRKRSRCWTHSIGLER